MQSHAVAGLVVVQVTWVIYNLVFLYKCCIKGDEWGDDYIWQ